MAHIPTKKMIETPHINVIGHCRKCKHLEAAISSISNSKIDWGTLRNACRCCKTGTKGIYKADAIYDLFKLQEKFECIPRNVGKKPTRYKTHGKRVMELKAEGYSIAAISRTLGIDWRTTKSIILKLTEDD